MSQNSLSPHSRGGRGLKWISAAGVLALGASHAHALGEMAGGTLKLNTIAEITADSNVFGNTSDLSDVFFTFKPELAFDRKGGRGEAHFDAGVAFDRYSDYSELNTENWSANGRVELPPGSGGRLSGSLNLTFFDGSEVDDFIAQRIEMQRLNLNLATSYELSGRSSARFGVNLSRYDTNLRPVSDSWAVRGGYSLELRPDIRGFIDLSHGGTKSDSAPGSTYVANYTTNNVSVGLDGKLSAKVTGSISVGLDDYSARSDDTAGDGQNFVSNVALTWLARPNTSVTLSGGQQNRIVSNGQSIDATTVTIAVRQRLGVAVSANGSVLWETFSTRDIADSSDDRVALMLNVEYSVRDQLAFGGGVRHNVRYSANPAFDISRTTLNIFGRYSF